MAKSDFVFSRGDPIDVGNPVENNFVFSDGELVSDGDQSDFAYIEDRSLGPGTGIPITSLRWNDNQNDQAVWLDAIKIDGSIADGFEDGDTSGWELTDPGDDFVADDTVSTEGVWSAKAIPDGDGDGIGEKEIAEQRPSSVEFSFYFENRPTDDFPFSFYNTDTEDRVFAWNLQNTDTSDPAGLELQYRGGRDPLGVEAPTETWTTCRVYNIDYDAGSFDWELSGGVSESGSVTDFDGKL